MATYNTESPAERGNSTAIIILALVVLAAIVIGAIYLMNYAPVTTNSNTSVTDRTVTRIEKVPAEVSKAVSNTADNVANPSTDQNPQPAPQPTPAQPTTTPQ